MSASQLNLLLIGDVCAGAGRACIEKLLPKIVEEHKIDFVIANTENATSGTGIGARHANELFACGIDVMTLGNHALRQRDIAPMLNTDDRIIRPANFPKRAPGKGLTIIEGHCADGTAVDVAVINLIGSLYLDQAATSPFDAADELIEEASKRTNIIIVDMHAEATSEKRAMGLYLDGRVSAVVGTHTHVQTSDAEIMAQGTAYMTDLGMTGPHDSVIGTRADIVIKRFTTGLGQRFVPSETGARLEGAVVSVDSASGRAESIDLLRMALPE